MQKEQSQVDSFIDQVADYGINSIELVKLKSVDKIAALGSMMLTRMVIAICLLFVALFLSIAVSIWVGNWLGELYLGFLMVAVFYLLLFVVLYLFRSSLLRMPFSNFIISKLLKLS